MTRRVALGVAVVLLAAGVLWQVRSGGTRFPPGIGSEPPPLAEPMISSARDAARAGTPELPRVSVDTTYSPPTGPRIQVPPGGDLQAALDAAQPGSVIVLQAGVTYTGNFALPVKTGPGSIYVESSALSSLPTSGTHVSPAQAAFMPKIVGNPALTAPADAHHFRFVGIEFRPPSGVAVLTLINLSGSHIVFDRCYIHGDPAAGGRAGVELNGTHNAVIDSHLSDWKHATLDAQAIWGWNGAGPFKIANNYLEAAGENVLFGGQDPTIPNLVPADIEVRGNHFFKPLSWRVGDPSFAGVNWVVKNIFELKNARRVLVDGNIFENNWTGNTNSQGGFAILFTPRNQYGGAPWAVVADVTFTHNVIRHSTAGFLLLGWDDISSSRQLQQILIRDNLLTAIGEFPDVIYRGLFTGMLFFSKNGPANPVFDHNTAIQTGFPVYGQNQSRHPQTTGFLFTNNVVVSNGGLCGDSTGCNALATLNSYFPGYVFAHNVLVAGNGADYPSGNFFPASLSHVGFVDLARGDYHLASASPYKHVGTDGRDLGADIDTIAMKMPSWWRTGIRP